MLTQAGIDRPTHIICVIHIWTAPYPVQGWDWLLYNLGEGKTFFFPRITHNGPDSATWSCASEIAGTTFSGLDWDWPGQGQKFGSILHASSWLPSPLDQSAHGHILRTPCSSFPLPSQTRHAGLPRPGQTYWPRLLDQHREQVCWLASLTQRDFHQPRAMLRLCCWCVLLEIRPFFKEANKSIAGVFQRPLKSKKLLEYLPWQRV